MDVLTITKTKNLLRKLRFLLYVNQSHVTLFYGDIPRLPLLLWNILNNKLNETVNQISLVKDKEDKFQVSTHAGSVHENASRA